MIQISVSFALLLQDDFNGTILSDDGHFFSIGERPIQPVRKPGGFYVFTGLSPGNCTLTIHSARYCDESVILPVGEIHPSIPVTVRLIRKREIYFQDCERLEGNFLPFADVLALVKENVSLRLLGSSSTPTGSVITLAGYTTQTLSGLRFCIGTGKSREEFVIELRQPDGSYRLTEPFCYKHKEGDLIRRVYRARCDAQGRYAISIEAGACANVERIEGFNEEARRWVCF